MKFGDCSIWHEHFGSTFILCIVPYLEGLKKTNWALLCAHGLMDIMDLGTYRHRRHIAAALVEKEKRRARSRNIYL